MADKMDTTNNVDFTPTYCECEHDTGEDDETNRGDADDHKLRHVVIAKRFTPVLICHYQRILIDRKYVIFKLKFHLARQNLKVSTGNKSKL